MSSHQYYTRSKSRSVKKHNYYTRSSSIIINKPIIKVESKIIKIKPKINAEIKKYKSSAIIPLKDRPARSLELFNNNKVSDEYYTRAETWKRFIKDKGLMGQTIYEPFYGDGSSRKVLQGLVNVVGKKGDFWENWNKKDCPQSYILTNPPFSFKWLIIQTFLEKRRPFAMIMPFQVFYGSSKKRLDTYATKYGGKWSKYLLTHKEQHYWSPIKESMVAIGTSILVWEF
jgi:hypothetical protein